MDSYEQIKREIIQSFGHAYQAFGLSTLMGKIVALLLFSDEPLSLDDISRNLEMSKGPISQIARRLTERNLIRKAWVPGSRRDHYEIHPEIFENAFMNNMDLNRQNFKIANDLKALISDVDGDSLKSLDNRLTEMARFYELMMEHYNSFLEAWRREKQALRDSSK